MNIRKLCLLMSLCCCLPVAAQTFRLAVGCVGEGFSEPKLYANALERRLADGVELKASGQRFAGEVPVASDGFYQLYGANGGVQVIVPFYLPGVKAGQEVALAASLVGGYLQVDGSADNKALSAFNVVASAMSREFWTAGKDWAPERFLPFLKRFCSAADSIGEVYACSQPVRQYLALWAYTQAENHFGNIPRVVTNKEQPLPFRPSELLQEPSAVFDTPMALYFPSTSSVILRSIPKGSLDEQLAYLHAHYTCDAVRRRMGEVIVERYLRTFDYAQHFDDGLAELRAAVAKYGLDGKSVTDFEIRRSTIPGAEFPKATLYDVNGNVVDISRYRGYYLYIDMWASWCVPCCREVPHLQKLEKELKNGKVKFVSISIDKGTKEWKARMQALNMHGNQLIDSKNAVGDALNISGIPHFLIYDPEGKLLYYDAPRPSSGEPLKQLLESLR